MGQSARRPRRGLSTLEMVLALPILLFVMALMLNYGTVASWKVRALSVARHAAWANRWPRHASLSPRPDHWPATGTAIGFTANGSIPELADLRVDRPVARGPLPFNTAVNSELLDPARGLARGSSGLTRDFPLLAKLGQYHLDAGTPLLEDTWEYQRTRWPERGAALPANVWRRIPVIYALAKADPALVNAFDATIKSMLGASYRSALRPLDDDEEFAYYGFSGAPNFVGRGRLAFACSLDGSTEQQLVDNLVDRIQGRIDRDASGRVVRRIRGVPEIMAEQFLALYNRAIQSLQNMLNVTPPPVDAASIQAQISELQAKVQLLEQFLQSLQ